MRSPRLEAFEIFYADGEIVSGTTKRQFEKAPEAGIQFVVVRAKDGSLVVHKGQDVYEYRGAKKPGSWTERENYDRIKASLMERSGLLVNRNPDPRMLRLRELRRLRGY